MSNVRDEFGSPVYQTDEYGNPIYQTDQYGKPIQPQAYTAETGTGTGTGGGDYGYGTAPTATGYGGGEPVMGATVGEQTQAQPIRTEPEHHEGRQRSKSNSSSSSSEDDGQGGRRKKGLKEKIKEKIPGMGHKKEEGHLTGTGAPATTGTTTASTGTTGYGHEQQHLGEKKGIMEKIKEKLPGGGGHH